MARTTRSPRPDAWLYLRLSTVTAGSRDSLAAQESKLRDRAAAEGLSVASVFSEGAGRSAYGAKGTTRPEWERLVSSVRPGVVVMAVETSRFSRDTEDGLRQIRRIRKAGGHVLTLDGNDSRLDASALPTTVRLAVAEEESRLKSERITRRKAAQRAAGVWPSRAPYGHRRRADGRLELDPESAPILRRAVDMALDGAGGVAIARAFNAEGIDGLRPGKAWNQIGLATLLRNPVLVGGMLHGGREVLADDGTPVRFVVGPTIMTVAERARLLSVTAERLPLSLKGAERAGGRPSSAPLAGVLVCGRCGAVMAPSGPNYVCATARTGRPCAGLTVTRSIVEPEALRRVRSYLAALDPAAPDDLSALVAVALAWSGAGPDAAAAQAAAHDAAGELADVEARLATLEEDFYVRGTLRADRFETLRAALSARIDNLRAAVRSSVPVVDVGPLLDLVQSSEAMDAASPAVLRSLVRASVESITLAPAASRGSRFDPARLSFVWRSSAEPAAA